MSSSVVFNIKNDRISDKIWHLKFFVTADLNYERKYGKGNCDWKGISSDETLLLLTTWVNKLEHVLEMPALRELTVTFQNKAQGKMKPSNMQHRAMEAMFRFMCDRIKKEELPDVSITVHSLRSDLPGPPSL